MEKLYPSLPINYSRQTAPHPLRNSVAAIILAAAGAVAAETGCTVKLEPNGRFATAAAGDAGDAGADGAAPPGTDAARDAADAADAATPLADAADATRPQDAIVDAADVATPADAADAGPPVCPPNACFAGIGKCERQGIEVCGPDGQPICNAVPGEPDPEETCGNGLDDNCNGLTDDTCVCEEGTTQPCYTGSIDTLNIGACRSGEQNCPDGHWDPACDGETLPEQEICGDETDNDCEDTVDNGCPCAVGAGACERNGVIQAPDGLCSAVPGEPAAEACNGIDDDCDTQTDEELPGAGRPCGAGIGECQRDGEMVCIPPAGILCNAQPGDPTEEICDGRDNDCDSVTDEACPCAEGVGACRRDGAIQENGACNAVAGEPTAETCNGRDDDCDTETDENLTRICEIECHQGIEICLDGQFINCNAAPIGIELCGDGIDNNCNEQIDEDGAQGCVDLYPDGDGDRFGINEGSICACNRPEAEFADRPGDCDDSNANINPDAVETPQNLRDEDCNGWTDDVNGAVNVRCEPPREPGYGMSIQPSGQVVYRCIGNELKTSGLGDTIISIPSHNSRPTLVTLIPAGSDPYRVIRARETDPRFGWVPVEIMPGCGAIDLPISPLGSEIKCWDNGTFCVAKNGCFRLM